MKITKADAIILNNLEYNSRISESQLAKLCRLSKDGVRYRINRLKTLNIIKGYSLFIDHKKLGYESYKLYFKLNSTIKQKKEFVDYLKNLPNTFGLFESYSGWNFAVALFAKNSTVFNSIENKILERFGDIIISKTFCSMIDAFLLNARALINKTKSHKLWGEIDISSLDEKDKKILKLLYINSRTPLIKLVSEVKLSINSIKKRLDKLLSKGIIMAFYTKINYEALGYNKYKLFIYPSNYSNDYEKKIISFLKGQKPVINIIRTIAPWKLEVEFLASSQEEVEKVLSQLNKGYAESILNMELNLFKNEEILPAKGLLI